MKFRAVCLVHFKCESTKCAHWARALHALSLSVLLLEWCVFGVVFFFSSSSLSCLQLHCGGWFCSARSWSRVQRWGPLQAQVQFTSVYLRVNAGKSLCVKYASAHNLSLLYFFLCRGKPPSRPTHHSRFTPFSVSRLLFRVRNTKMSFKWNEKRQKNTAKKKRAMKEATSKTAEPFFVRFMATVWMGISSPSWPSSANLCILQNKWKWWCDAVRGALSHSSREVLCEMAAQRPSRATATRGCKTNKMGIKFVWMVRTSPECGFSVLLRWKHRTDDEKTNFSGTKDRRTRNKKKNCPRPV